MLIEVEKYQSKERHRFYELNNDEFHDNEDDDDNYDDGNDLDYDDVYFDYDYDVDGADADSDNEYDGDDVDDVDDIDEYVDDNVGGLLFSLGHEQQPTSMVSP